MKSEYLCLVHFYTYYMSIPIEKTQNLNIHSPCLLIWQDFLTQKSIFGFLYIQMSYSLQLFFPHLRDPFCFSIFSHTFNSRTKDCIWVGGVGYNPLWEKKVSTKDCIQFGRPMKSSLVTDLIGKSSTSAPYNNLPGLLQTLQKVSSSREVMMGYDYNNHLLPLQRQSRRSLPSRNLPLRIRQRKKSTTEKRTLGKGKSR